MKIIIEYNGIQEVIHEFSETEMLISGLEMPVIRDENNEIIGHGLINWLKDGGLNQVLEKPKYLIDRLILRAKNNGWFEENNVSILPSNEEELVNLIVQFPNYKTRKEIDIEISNNLKN